jgi:hypothetical protein
VACHKEEAPLPIEQSERGFKQPNNMPFQLERLTARTVTVTGWIENDSPVELFAAHFTAEKLAGIFHDPMDGRLTESGKLGISPGPCYHILCCVNVKNLSTGERCRQGAPSRVSEEIQDRTECSTLLDMVIKPTPIDDLFGKKPHVSGLVPFEFEGQWPPTNSPSLGDIPNVKPLPKIPVRSLKSTVGFCPQFGGKWNVLGCRTGPIEDDRSKSF